MQERLKLIAREAGRAFLRRELTSVSSKEGHANYVTNIDCTVQAFLEKELLQLLPGSQFIGEEKENSFLTDRPTWIVDPLDGTTNLIHDYRTSAVSIALCENRRPVLGLIWQPYAKEMFFAESGKGAFLNDRPIHVADTPFSEALVAFGTAPYYEELETAGMAMAAEFLHRCADIRRSGSAAIDLASLAAGRIDAFFEMRLKPWDYAAGSLIVQEAGGSVRMPLAEKTDYDQSTAIVAGTPAVMDQVMDVFRKGMGRTAPKPVDYGLLADQAREIISADSRYVAALSNLSAVIMDTLPDLNWAGFYLMRDGQLVVGPFQGKPACIHIPVGRGVCGTAAEKDETQIVPDVHAFPGHIACDGASASEIVIPIHRNGRVAGVLDIDSPVKGRFTRTDAEGLAGIVKLMEEMISWENDSV